MKSQREPITNEHIPVKPSEVKKAQKTKVKPEITKEECQENLDKVERMLHKRQFRIRKDDSTLNHLNKSKIFL